jgi:hypothetical protein
MKKKINILSSIDLKMLSRDILELKKRANLYFSINSRKKTIEKIKTADIYIASAYFVLDKYILDKAKKLRVIFINPIIILKIII